MATRIKAAPGNRRYDWVQIQADRTAGMSVKELCTKYGCTDVSVYNRTVMPGNLKTTGDRHRELEQVRNTDWTAAQNDRTKGMALEALSKKYSVSKSTIFKHTKSVKKSGSGIYPRQKASKAVLVTMNGSANARELARQALVLAVAEREKLNKFIEQLEAVNS